VAEGRAKINFKIKLQSVVSIDSERPRVASGVSRLDFLLEGSVGSQDELAVQGLVEQVQIPAKDLAFQVFPHLRQESHGAIKILQGQVQEPRRLHGLDPGRYNILQETGNPKQYKL